MSTASVFILNYRGDSVNCKILLDSESQSNFITERLSKELNITKKEVNVLVSGFNQNLTHIKHSIDATFQSRQKHIADLTFLVVSRITEKFPSQSIDKRFLNFPQNITLADPEFCNPLEIDVLIGAEVFYNLLCVDQIKLNNSALILQKTRLEWVVSGKIDGHGSAPRRIACNLTMDSLESQVVRFWEVEEVPSLKHLSEIEKACEEYFSQTHRRDQNSRYIVRLPFNDKKCDIGESYLIAKKRLYSLETRLKRDLNTYEQYSRFLNEYENLGHMTKIIESNQEEGYFIPHHAVIKDDSHTTKLRVVFDSSSKTSSGISLNDSLLTGPNIQEELFTIFMRFRIHRYALSADLEKMYRQIQVHHEDVNYQRIL